MVHNTVNTLHNATMLFNVDKREITFSQNQGSSLPQQITDTLYCNTFRSHTYPQKKKKQSMLLSSKCKSRLAHPNAAMWLQRWQLFYRKLGYTVLHNLLWLFKSINQYKYSMMSNITLYMYWNVSLCSKYTSSTRDTHLASACPLCIPHPH